MQRRTCIVDGISHLGEWEMYHVMAPTGRPTEEGVIHGSCHVGNFPFLFLRGRGEGRNGSLFQVQAILGKGVRGWESVQRVKR